MIRIAAHSVPDQFGNNLRTTLLRELELFENEYSCAFAHDKSVPVFVEGTGGAMRFLVARR